MKRSAKVYGLMLVLALLVLVTVVAVRNNASDSGDSQSQEKTTVFALEEETVTALSWTWNDETISLEREDEVWSYPADGDFPLDDTKPNAMLATLTQIQSDKTIESPEDLEEYGLSEPTVTISVTTAEEGTCEILLGDETGLGGSRYCSVGDGKVYLVDDSIVDDFAYGLYDLVKMESIPSMKDILHVTVSADTRELEIEYLEDSGLTYSDSYVWFLNRDGDYVTLDTELTEDFLSCVTDLKWLSCVDYQADEAALEEYGLSEPAAVVQVDYVETTQKATNETDEDGDTIYETVETEKTFSLELGSLSGDACYARLADSQMVYLIDSAVLDALRYTTGEELRPDEVLLLDAETIDTVDVTIGADTYTIAREIRQVETEADSSLESSSAVETEVTEETVYLVEDQEVDFEPVLEQLTSMTATGTASIQTDAAEELTLVFHRNTGDWQTVTLTFYSYDSSNCLVSLNGEARLLVSRDRVKELVTDLKELTAE